MYRHAREYRRVGQAWATRPLPKLFHYSNDTFWWVTTTRRFAR